MNNNLKLKVQMYQNFNCRKNESKKIEILIFLPVSYNTLYKIKTKNLRYKSKILKK